MGELIEMPAAPSPGLVIKKLESSEKTKSTFEALRAISDASFDGVERPPSDTLKQHYLNGDVFVLYVGDLLVGFAVVTPLRRDVEYLWSIAIRESHRGLGLSNRLLGLMSSHYMEGGRAAIELTCKIDNPAQIVYFKNGYRVQSVQRAFYGSEGDGLRMRLELTPKAA